MIILFCSVCVLFRIVGFKKQEIQMTCSKTPRGVGVTGDSQLHGISTHCCISLCISAEKHFHIYLTKIALISFPSSTLAMKEFGFITISVA